MDIQQRFAQVMEQRHKYAQEWKKRTGGKVVAYFCPYVPEEILYAAGALPVRIFASHEPEDLSAAYIPARWCGLCRDCLAQGLRGDYAYLDGLCHAHTCNHLGQTFYSWTSHRPVDFSYALYVPHNTRSPSALPCFQAELLEFQKALEGWLNTRISETALEQASKVYNQNRRLLREVYEIRKLDGQISGSHALEVVMSSCLMDKREHNQLLDELLARVRDSGHESGEAKPRIMMLGSENDNINAVKMIESQGCQVVVEDTCVGARYFWNDVIGDGDAVAAIASRYLSKPPCPQNDLVERRRSEWVLELAREFRVQGAIFLRQKFCDTYAYEIPPLVQAMKEHNIPALVLETDVTMPVGQFSTRVQAFLEMLDTAKQGVAE